MRPRKMQFSHNNCVRNNITLFYSTYQPLLDAFDKLGNELKTNIT